MKKIISLALVFAMIMSLGITAFAEETDPLAPQGGDVTASYVPAGSLGGTVYSVDVTWTSFEFTYYQGSTPTWDPVTHQYSESPEIEEGWGESEATITVVNNSNVHLKATPSYAAAEGFEGIGMNFNIAELVVPSADIDFQEQSASIKVTPYGTLSEEITEATKIGTITIAISEFTTSYTETNVHAIGDMRTEMYNNITMANEEGWTEVKELAEDAIAVFDEYEKGNATFDECILAWIKASNAYNANSDRDHRWY